MLSEPCRELRLVDFSTGKRKNQRDNALLRAFNSQSVQADEDVHRLKRDALVAIDKRMISGDAESVRGSENGEVALTIVLKAIAWSLEGRLKEPPVTHTRSTSVPRDLICLNRQDHANREPARLRHFASSRMALRYFFAPSS